MNDSSDPLKSALTAAADILKQVTTEARQNDDADVAKSAGQVQYVIVGKFQSLPPGSEVSDSKLLNLQRAIGGFKDQLGDKATACSQTEGDVESAASNIEKSTALMNLAACLGAAYLE